VKSTKNHLTVKKVITFIFILSIFLEANSQISSLNRVYEIWEDKPAQNRGADYSIEKPGRGFPFDADWEEQAYPIGNGYMGAMIFGRTDTERIQLTESTLANESPYGRGGLTNFAEIYLHTNHYSPKNYKRALNLNDGILYVNYEQDRVKYSREYLANYPENIIAVRLSSNKKKKISFTLTAEIPYLRSTHETNTRTGKTQAENDLITLSGNIAYFSLNYEAQIKVINDGGQLFVENDNRNAQIRVVNANSVVLLISAGTNYKLSQSLFLETEKKHKLDGKVFPNEKVTARINNAASMGYIALKASHQNDFKKIFSRVNLELSTEIPKIPTSTLLKQYKAGKPHPYIEELIFHFGRYLLIASSREGSLPAGLQGVWSNSEITPWSGGYWHNINVQMNYWGAFNTNMAETFIPYMEFFNAYYPKARQIATEYIKKNQPHNLGDDNGWAIGTGSTAYSISSPGGHSGPGTGGLTTKMLWDYYDFTRDTTFLREVAFPVIYGMGKFLSKTLKPNKDGLLLVDPSASPEIRIKNERGGFSGPHYVTTGTTFDQGMVWETYNDLLKAAAIIGKDDSFLDVVRDQITKLDPIIIGASGQIKEFREEDAYGDIGDPNHRHISHLIPLYPGTLINSKTPEWMQGASFVLDKRGNRSTGWGLVHRMNLRARVKDGENAHKVFSTLIKERTSPNLWTVHPPFQIDSNLGLVAGVAEMLIQSHEDFIDLLPALPEAWKSGRFDGLVARGNFEVSAKWNNQLAKDISVKSKSGGVCRIKIPNLISASIKNDKGMNVQFKIVDKDIVEFSTLTGSVYHLSDIKR
jgi:alpha-L-fucosidase 2